MAAMGFPQLNSAIPIQHGYQPIYSQPQPAQQSYYAGAPQSYQAPIQKVMEYVDGEVGALTFRQPAGWPANLSIPLWDSQSQLIYFKAWDPMGRSYPLVTAKYEWVNAEPQKLLPPGQSGAQTNTLDGQPANYATKEDMEQLKREVRGIAQQILANQNGMQQPMKDRNRGEQNA